jgi:hypothetical protein
MRTAIFCLMLLAAPALLGQSAAPLQTSPGALSPPHSGDLTALTPQAQDWWAQQPNGGWQAPLLAENRPFAFAMPSPQMPTGRMEPIPTQWPHAKFEGIPTRWKNLKVVPAGTAAPGTSGTTLFAQPARK